MARATILPRFRLVDICWNRPATRLLPCQRYGEQNRQREATATRLIGPRPAILSAQPLAVRVPGIARDIRVQFAACRDDWEQAFQLVADNYQARGFDREGFDYRFTSYHALPQTVVLVAKEGARVVATFSLVPDNPILGLPLEGLYREEVRGLRRQKRRLIETGSLACRDLELREFVQVFLTLMHLGWQYGTRQGIETTVITVNPRHSAYYLRLCGFVSLGPRRAYDKVQGAPAEAFYLDPSLMQARAPAMYQRFFGVPLPAGCLVAPRLPGELIRHFARHSSQTDLRTVEQILWLTDSVASGEPPGPLSV